MAWIGWVGATLLAGCGLPQAVLCWRQGHAQALSWGFLAMWLGGEVLTLGYIWAFQAPSYPLICNYSVNILALLVIFRFKIWPRK